MAEKKTAPKSVDEYLANVPTKMAPALHALRAAIRAAAPDAEEIKFCSSFAESNRQNKKDRASLAQPFLIFLALI